MKLKIIGVICTLHLSILRGGLAQIPPPPPPPPSTPFAVQTPPPISTSTGIPQTSLPTAPTANPTAVAKPVDPKRPLAGVIEWAVDKGANNIIDKGTAFLFGFGKRELRVRQKGFKWRDGAARIFAVITEKGGSDVAIADLDKDGNGYVWLTSASGRLLKTVQILTAGVRLVPNSEREADFEHQKAYWLRKLAEASAESPRHDPEQ